jgi:hypothetical protein
MADEDVLISYSNTILLSMSSGGEGGRKILTAGRNLKSKDKKVPRKTKTVIPMYVAEEEIVTV